VATISLHKVIGRQSGLVDIADVRTNIPPPLRSLSTICTKLDAHVPSVIFFQIYYYNRYCCWLLSISFII